MKALAATIVIAAKVALAILEDSPIATTPGLPSLNTTSTSKIKEACNRVYSRVSTTPCQKRRARSNSLLTKRGDLRYQSSSSKVKTNKCLQLCSRKLLLTNQKRDLLPTNHPR